MTEIDATLQVIAIALFLLLLFKDMSGQDQLRGIKEELKRIADALERREKELRSTSRGRRLNASLPHMRKTTFPSRWM